MKRIISIAIYVLVGLIVAANYLLVDIIPPESETLGALTGAQIRIQLYVAEHHRLPDKLADLPPRPNHSDRDIDGWGKPLIYAPQPDGSVVITSPGKDGDHNARSVRFSIIPSEDKVNLEAETMTEMNLSSIAGEIRKWGKEHHRLPNSFTEVPVLQQRPELLTDGWNRPISYTPQPDGSVLLTSHGQPGTSQIFSLQFTVPGITQFTPTTASN